MIGMNARTRRIIARVCIVIDLAAMAAAGFALGLGHLSFTGALRIDVPAIVGFVGSRLYLHSTAARR